MIVYSYYGAKIAKRIDIHKGFNIKIKTTFSFFSKGGFFGFIILICS